MEGVFCPLVSVPPLTVQEYEAPAPALATDAVFPLEPRQAEVAAVIAQFVLDESEIVRVFEH